MKLRVLAIDDDADVQLAVEGVLMSLGHDYEIVADQESAQKLLDTKEFDLTLLDLEIPVAPEQKARRENGINLLANIRKAPRTAKLPVIVLTGHGGHSPELAVRLMKMGADDYVLKPIGDGRLDQAIREMESKMGKQSSRNLASAPALALTPFSAAPREMIIHEDRVTICGIEVWRETGQSQMRQLLLLLNRKEHGGFARISGPELTKQLGRNETNPISRPIKDFRDNASMRLRDARHLICGSQDVIASQNGYHFAEWMRITVADESLDAPLPPTPETADCTALDNGRDLNTRQQWIMARLRTGRPLRLKDIVHETRKHRSTVLEDLKVLKDRGLAATAADGGYVLGPEAEKELSGGAAARG